MGKDSFLDDDFLDDDFLDDDFLDDEDEGFEYSESLISKLTSVINRFTIKQLLIFSGLFTGLVIIYFVNYSLRTNVNNETTPPLSESTTSIPSSNSTTSTTPETTVAKVTETTVKPQQENNRNSLNPLSSTVMVALPDCGYMGSGTLVSKLGFILTNEHVISDDGTNCNDYIVILTSESGEKDPEPKFIAEVVESNISLDIAILEITATFDGTGLQKTFKNMCIGDSDTISLGDDLLIWGYPDVRWVNFDSPGRIDVSQGFVSGFDAESGLSEKAWISLSSTISSGNSGGGAYNEQGQLVGVPTAVFEGNLSSRGLLRPINLILNYFDSFYFEFCK